MQNTATALSEKFIYLGMLGADMGSSQLARPKSVKPISLYGTISSSVYFFEKLVGIHLKPKPSQNRDKVSTPTEPVSLDASKSLTKEDSDGESTFFNSDSAVESPPELSESPVSLKRASSTKPFTKSETLSLLTVSPSESDHSSLSYSNTQPEEFSKKQKLKLVSLSQLLEDAGFQSSVANSTSARRSKRFSIASSESLKSCAAALPGTSSHSEGLEGLGFSLNSDSAKPVVRASARASVHLEVNTALVEAKHARSHSSPVKGEPNTCKLTPMSLPKVVFMRQSGHQRSVSMTHNWAYHQPCPAAPLTSEESVCLASSMNSLPLYSAQIVSVGIFQGNRALEHDSWLDASALANLGDRSAAVNKAAEKRARAALSMPFKNMWWSLTGCHVDYEIRVGQFKPANFSRRLSTLLDGGDAGSSTATDAGCSGYISSGLGLREELPIHSRKGSWIIRRRYREFLALYDNIVKVTRSMEFDSPNMSANRLLIGIPEFPPKTNLLANCLSPSISFEANLANLRRNKFAVDTIRERRYAFQSLLNYVTSHPILGSLHVVQQFLGG